MKTNLIEGEDFTYNAKGQMVFTSSFLAKRGWCCKSGCTNCPYEKSKSQNPSLPQEYLDNWSSEEKTTDELKTKNDIDIDIDELEKKYSDYF